MKLQFKQLHETGERGNNEDNVYPKSTEKNPVDNLFMVCDGVGGAEKGEVASSIACASVAEFMRIMQQTPEIIITDDLIQDAVHQAEQGMQNYIADFPESKGMASTFAMLYFTPQNAVIAHCGDSRVYHIRNGKILFQTHDHSLVNELLASGFIKTEEEARNHPKKNMITRALSGDKDIAVADVKFIPNDEIFRDDLFLLCSDGVLESIDNPTIEQILKREKSPEEIINEIYTRCEGHSNDNYSAIVVKVMDGKEYVAAEKTKLVTAEATPIISNPKAAGDKTEETLQSGVKEETEVCESDLSETSRVETTEEKEKKEKSETNGEEADNKAQIIIKEKEKSESDSGESENKAQIIIKEKEKIEDDLTRKAGKPVRMLVAGIFLVLVITAGLWYFLKNDNTKPNPKIEERNRKIHNTGEVPVPSRHNVDVERIEPQEPEEQRNQSEQNNERRTEPRQPATTRPNRNSQPERVIQETKPEVVKPVYQQVKPEVKQSVNSVTKPEVKPANSPTEKAEISVNVQSDNNKIKSIEDQINELQQKINQNKIAMNADATTKSTLEYENVGLQTKIDNLRKEIDKLKGNR